MNKKNQLKPMPLLESLVLFGIPTIIFVIITRILIPYINRNLGIHPALTWFIFGGLFVFVPIFILSLTLFSKDGYKFNFNIFINRFRLNKLSKTDWLWTLCSIIVILLLASLIMFISKLLSDFFGIKELSTSSSFVHFDSLKGKELLILLVWLPFFFFNIFGEELLWRGYILPRQELNHGRFAWLINSLLWLVFHICFGVDLMIILLPIIFVLPYVVSKRKKTWIGIIIHTIVNGPTFVLVALGLIK